MEERPRFERTTERKCPKCHSENVRFESIAVEGIPAKRQGERLTCLDCEKRGEDVVFVHMDPR